LNNDFLAGVDLLEKEIEDNFRPYFYSSSYGEDIIQTASTLKELNEMTMFSSMHRYFTDNVLKRLLRNEITKITWASGESNYYCLNRKKLESFLNENNLRSIHP
jgi:hypothetical protein